MSLHDLDYKKGGIFAAGVLFGTAGIKALSSKDAKNVYTKITAAVLRAKDCVLDVVSNIQENAQDIYAGAQQINDDRAAAEEAADAEGQDEAEETAEAEKDVKRLEGGGLGSAVAAGAALGGAALLWKILRG